MPQNSLSTLLSKVLTLQEQVNAVVAELSTMNGSAETVARRDPPADEEDIKRLKNDLGTMITLPKHVCEYLRTSLKWIPVKQNEQHTTFSWVFFVDPAFDSNVSNNAKFLSLFGDDVLKRARFIMNEPVTKTCADLEYIVGVVDNQDMYTFELFYPHPQTKGTSWTSWMYALNNVASLICNSFRNQHQQKQEPIEKSFYRFVQCLLLDAGMTHITGGVWIPSLNFTKAEKLEMKKAIVESLHSWMISDVEGWQTFPRLLKALYIYDLGERTAKLWTEQRGYIEDEFMDLYPAVFAEVGNVELNKRTGHLVHKYGKHSFVYRRLLNLNLVKEDDSSSVEIISEDDDGYMLEISVPAKFDQCCKKDLRKAIAAHTKHPETYEFYDVKTSSGIATLAVSTCDRSTHNLNADSRFSSVVILPIASDEQVLQCYSPRCQYEMHDALVQLAEQLSVRPLRTTNTKEVMEVFMVCLLLADSQLLDSYGVCGSSLSARESQDYARRFVIALHKLRGKYPCYNNPTNFWQHLYCMVQEHQPYLGSSTVVLKWGAKEYIKRYFFSMYAEEFGIHVDCTYDEDIIRSKFSGTLVEDRLNAILKANPKSKEATIENLSTIMCYPVATTKCSELSYYFFKPQQEDFFMFCSNNKQVQNLYVKLENNKNLYSVIDPLNATLFGSGHHFYVNASTIASKVLNSIKLETSEPPSLQDLNVTLERILVVLRCFAFFFKANGWRIMNGDKPVPAPTLNNANKALLLQSLRKLMSLSLSLNGAKAVWQEFLHKLVGKNCVKTLDGTEYYFVNWDIRFLLTQFLPLYNIEVFDVTALSQNTVEMHSRDNYYTLQQLAKRTYSYSYEELSHSYVQVEDEYACQYLKAWYTAQPQQMYKASVSHWELSVNRLIGLDDVTQALKAASVAAKSLQDSDYEKLVKLLLAYTTEDVELEYRFLQQLGDYMKKHTYENDGKDTVNVNFLISWKLERLASLGEITTHCANNAFFAMMQHTYSSGIGDIDQVAKYVRNYLRRNVLASSAWTVNKQSYKSLGLLLIRNLVCTLGRACSALLYEDLSIILEHICKLVGETNDLKAGVVKVFEDMNDTLVNRVIGTGACLRTAHVTQEVQEAVVEWCRAHKD